MNSSSNSLELFFSYTGPSVLRHAEPGPKGHTAIPRGGGASVSTMKKSLPQRSSWGPRDLVEGL